MGAGSEAVCLLRNRASTRNRGTAIAAMPAGVRLFETEGIESLAGTLAAIREAGPSLLILDGGDGTVREVVSRLDAVWGAAPVPAMAILKHGNTNLIGRKTGAGLGRAGLERLLAAHGAGRLSEIRQPVIDIHRTGEAPLSGFIAGWGAYEAGTRIADEEIAARGKRQVRLAVLAVLRRALIGAEARALRAGVAASVAIDGVAMEDGARFLGLVSTLEGALVGGLRPFWEEPGAPRHGVGTGAGAGQGVTQKGAGTPAGAIRWLDVMAPARWLPLAAPFALVGRPMGWMRRAGYRSGRAETLELTLPPGAGLVVDGERFGAGADGRVRFAVGRQLRFVAP